MQRYYSVFFQYMRKMSLVNETLRPETETRPRPRRSHFSPRPRRDRDVGKMRLETVSRPRRRDGTTSLADRVLRNQRSERSCDQLL